MLWNVDICCRIFLALHAAWTKVDAQFNRAVSGHKKSNSILISGRTPSCEFPDFKEAFWTH